VLDAAKGGPAARAEVRAGDAVLAVSGAPVTGLADFYRRLWALGPAGVTATLRLEREGDIFEVDVRTVDRAAKLKKPRFN
jgi:S1-C subfamily serine protease